MIRVRLGRLAYRVAYQGLRVYSVVFRPRTRGVKCLVRHGGEILLVRATYGPGDWDIPGGFARRDEPYADAARRELGEELSLSDVGTLTDLGELRRDHMGRRETLGLVRVEPPGRALVLRLCEIRCAGWFAPDALPAERSDVVDEVLAHERSLSPSGGG